MSSGADSGTGEPQSPPPSPSPPARSRGRLPAWLRLVIVGAILLTLFLIGESFGLRERYTTESLRETVRAGGVWGLAIYLVVFSLGELVHIPGLVFMAAGVLAFGPVLGGALAYVGALVSVTATFLVIRAGGGQALTEIDRPWLQRLLARLDAHPIRTVVLLRVLLWLSPPLNYALGLSGIRLRDYLIGSAIGLIPVSIGAALVFG